MAAEEIKGIYIRVCVCARARERERERKRERRGGGGVTNRLHYIHETRIKI